MADFAHDAPPKSAICKLLKASPPCKDRALVGSPLKSSAVTVHLAGSGILRLERITSVYVHSWKRHCTAGIQQPIW